MVRKFLRKYSGLAAALVFGVVAGAGLFPAFATSVLTNFTGAAGTNPAQCPTCISDYAKIINVVNNELLNLVNFNNSQTEAGEMAFQSANSFAANGTTAVSAIGSTGPITMTHGIVFEWLTTVDEGGAIGYIPVYR